MKRMHVHVSVENIEKSVSFYSALFATKPTVVKDDYAKWMLDDPRVNFAISTRGRQPGLDHLGIQVESPTNCRRCTRAFVRLVAKSLSKGNHLLLHQVREVVDRRPRGCLVGNVPHVRPNTNYGDSFDKEARVAHQKGAAHSKPASSCCAA